MSSQKNNYNKILTSLFLVSLLFFASFSIIYINSLNSTVPFVNANSGKLGVALKVSVYDAEGNLKQEVIKDDDLVIDNFIKFLTAFFTSADPSDASLTNNAGAGCTIRVRLGDDNQNTFADSETDTEDKGGFIGIGTDATAPTRTDFDLGTIQESLTAVDGGYPVYSSATGNITIQCSITVTGTYNIVEAGLFVNWVDTSSNVNTIMMLHDTFNPVAVIPTDIAVVSYTLILSGSEFNQNFGEWLEGLFTNCLDNTTVSKTFYRTDNDDEIISVYSPEPDTSWVGRYFNTGTPYFDTSIRIGTDNTAPTRTDLDLGGVVEDWFMPNPAPTYTATTCLIRTSITVSAERTISESAIYLYIPTYTGKDDHFMFWRDTFTPVVIASGTAMDVIYTLTFS